MENKRLDKLENDMRTVTEWRKSGKVLNKEEQQFAERVVDEMIAIKNEGKVGVQLVSGKNMRFAKAFPVGEAGTAGGPARDMVSSSQGKKELTDEEKKKLKKPLEVAKAFKSPKPAKLATSKEETGSFPEKSPTADKVRLKSPENQNDGEVTSVADGALEVDEMEPIEGSEEIGHQPNLPMPKKQAEDLIKNAIWGVEIGAYGNLKEGISAQLQRKDYSEFVDTPEKLKGVVDWLNELSKEVETTPVAEG